MTITRSFPTPPTTNTLTNWQQSVTNTLTPNNSQTEVFSQGAQLQYSGATGQGPLATKGWNSLVTMTSGAATLDLTALDNGEDVQNMTGLALMEIFVISHEDNDNLVTIAPGASNPYDGWVGDDGLILKTANDQNKLGPLYGSIDVDGTHKTIDIAGTGSEKVYVSLLFG